MFHFLEHDILFKHVRDYYELSFQISVVRHFLVDAHVSLNLNVLFFFQNASMIFATLVSSFELHQKKSQNSVSLSS